MFFLNIKFLPYLIVGILQVTFFLVIPFLGLEDNRSLTWILWFFPFTIGFVQFFITGKKVSVSNSTLSKANFSLLVLSIFCITFHFIYIFQKHKSSFFLADNDYISMAEVLNETAKGNFFRTHYHGDPDKANYLAHHFSPGIILLTPFLKFSAYRWGYAYGLLVALLLSLGIFAKSIQKLFPHGPEYPVFLGIYTLNLFQYRLLFSYHFEVLFLCFFLLAVYGQIQNSRFLFFFGIILSLLVKEDIGYYLALYGIYLVCKKKTIGIPVIIISLAYSSLLIPILQSFFDPSAHENWKAGWSYFGNSTFDILTGILQNPAEVYTRIRSKIHILPGLLAGLGGFGILDPLFWLCSLPLIFLHFLSDRIWYNTLYNYYIYPVLGLLLLNFLNGYRITKLYLLQRFRVSKNKVLGLLLISLALTLHQTSKDKLVPLYPGREDLERTKRVTKAVNLIPPEKEVSAQFDLSPFIRRTNPVYPVRQNQEWREYVLLDTINGFTPYYPKEEILHRKEALIREGRYSLEFEESGVMLLKRK